MSKWKFEKILEPMKIGTMEVRNRFVMPPMVTNYAAEDGSVTDRIIDYHVARAKGGVGLIIVEAIYVHQTGKGFSNELGINRDELVPGLRKLVEAVHHHGAKIACQLYHAGRQTSSDVTGARLVAPSPIPCPVKQEVPKQLTTLEIRGLVEEFRQAARRAKQAGFDAVEIHGAHGYLLNQFLSPYSNKREDEYGGSFENRMRFPLEVVNSVREEVGIDFPIIYRLSAEEYVDGGLTIDDTSWFAVKLVEAGVNAVHVSGGVYASAAMIIQPSAIPQGLYIENATAIKRAIEDAVPVIVVGRIKNPEMAEAIIRGGNADFVAMGRALLSDPDLPNKVRNGQSANIRNCLGCNQGCIDRLFEDIDIACMINPLTGHEGEFDLTAPVEKKKVLIIGGGPAGLEATRVAALRGHETILFEKEDELGGQLRLAAKPPFKSELYDLLHYQIKQVENSNAEVVKGWKADISAIKELNPDVVILATGSEPVIPNLPGIFQSNVVTGHDVLKDSVPVGNNVVVLGGGMVGCETAEYLAEQGKQVTLVEVMADIAVDVGMLNRSLMFKRMAEKNITVLSDCQVHEIDGNTVKVTNKDGHGFMTGIDTVVIAVGSRSLNEMAELIKREGFPVYTIGDAKKPRKILEAVHEGFRVAYNIDNIASSNRNFVIS
ncbi:FAD-dependent oxidoreductase [Bacillus marasmi]|uniref:oxidoreductase n=1 Tax=Bacillus marasmi TaxID=1926279 RepID=UPI00164ED6DE|nr:FAD-dependent oxidoreductase [Bacillus marasmi]